MKKTIAFVCALLCFGNLIAGCASSEPQETLSPNADYSVTVTDSNGEVFTTGVIVQFLQNGQQVAMQPVGAAGAAVKNLPRGDYSVELMFTDSDAAYYYDKAELTLSAEKTQLQISLKQMPVGMPQDLVTNFGTYQAYNVKSGATWVTLKPGMNYFLFSAEKAGTYKISAPADVAELGYYGMPHFVQESSALEVVNNSVTISIKESALAGVYVFGLKATADTNCTLLIERIGDPQWDISDEPWTAYKPTVELSQYILPDGSKLTDFDLTAKNYELVLGSDGFYHLNDSNGPLVVVYLGVSSKYLDSFQKMVDSSRVGKIFYDGQGNFLKKESYNECLLSYFEVMDENAGVYPLTEDLKYIIQQRGDYYGWWDAAGKGYIFVDAQGTPDVTINPDVAWLFACAYIAQ
ncbi:MAG: hypothetical protein J6A88_01175 [Oscillospiraceae bacterium]|nr:hypothetical protein [Oscillospiraceae bacterium]